MYIESLKEKYLMVNNDDETDYSDEEDVSKKQYLAITKDDLDAFNQLIPIYEVPGATNLFHVTLLKCLVYIYIITISFFTNIRFVHSL